jgi:hypothetical protein
LWINWSCIVLPAKHRPQGFVDAHNPHTPARVLSQWPAMLREKMLWGGENHCIHRR